jgi:hypothetical protein
MTQRGVLPQWSSTVSTAEMAFAPAGPVSPDRHGTGWVVCPATCGSRGSQLDMQQRPVGILNAGTDSARLQTIQLAEPSGNGPKPCPIGRRLNDRREADKAMAQSTPTASLCPAPKSATLPRMPSHDDEDQPQVSTGGC